MSISPFEERYATRMNEVFEEKQKLRRWMDVEIALAKVHAELGNIPKDAPKMIEEGSRRVDVSRVKEIEAEIHHDLMALVKALSEQSGDASKYVHLGSTSYDIEDTATALIFLDAIRIIEEDGKKLAQILKKLAKENIDRVCIGRTHGQHAVPTTYGMKFALYYREILRSLERLSESRKRIAVGKMAGAVGTMATFGDQGMEIQEKVMKELGLSPAEVSNQVVQRDRHAEVLSDLAIFAASIEKIAKEIRNLQRTEILEISESFAKKQVGSSTMPHKRNPHKSERVCSLARVLRGNIVVALENIALEHERDLTNSANERVIFAESFICLDYMILEISKILEGLQFSDENIKKNLELTGGLIMAERLMIALTEEGMGRQEAHELARTLAQEAFREKKHLKDLAIERKVVSRELAEKVFDYSSYTGKAREIVRNATRD